MSEHFRALLNNSVIINNITSCGATMLGKYNHLNLHNIKFIVTGIVIVTQFLQVHARVLSTFNEPVVLLSLEEILLPGEAPAIPKDCQKAGLCEDVGNYPTELVAMIMNKLSLKNITRFTNDKLYDNEYSNDLGEIQDLCETKKERILFPRAAKDHNKNWQFILNMHGRHFQSFRVHECLDVPETPCSKAAYVTDIDYSLVCDQQYTKREMVYLNLEKRVVETGYFLVPSCCWCYLEPT